MIQGLEWCDLLKKGKADSLQIFRSEKMDDGTIVTTAAGPQIGLEIRPQTDRFLKWQFSFTCSRPHDLLLLSVPAKWPIVFLYCRTSICTILCSSKVLI